MATVGGGLVGCVQLSALQVEAASDGPAWVGEGTMPTPIGAVLISRLAVDRAWQRRGVAGVLGWHALVLAAAIAVGTRARLLVARSDGDLQFGVRLGFRPLAGHPGWGFADPGRAGLHRRRWGGRTVARAGSTATRGLAPSGRSRLGIIGGGGLPRRMLSRQRCECCCEQGAASRSGGVGA